jgi:hypothetical protein
VPVFYSPKYFRAFLPLWRNRISPFTSSLECVNIVSFTERDIFIFVVRVEGPYRWRYPPRPYSIPLVGQPTPPTWVSLCPIKWVVLSSGDKECANSRDLALSVESTSPNWGGQFSVFLVGDVTNNTGSDFLLKRRCLEFFVGCFFEELLNLAGLYRVTAGVIILHKIRLKSASTILGAWACENWGRNWKINIWSL